MPQRREGKIFLMFGFFLFLVFIGCRGTGIMIEKKPSEDARPAYNKGGPPPWAPAHGYRAKHTYRYYPSSRVYYDRKRGLYFYYENGQWRVSVSLPSGIRVNVNNYITLEMDTDKPYEWDHEVMKKYPPGQLKKKHKKKGKGKWK